MQKISQIGKIKSLIWLLFVFRECLNEPEDGECDGGATETQTCNNAECDCSGFTNEFHQNICCAGLNGLTSFQIDAYCSSTSICARSCCRVRASMSPL